MGIATLSVRPQFARASARRVLSVTWMTMEKNVLEHRNYRECLVPLLCKLSYNIGKGVFEESASIRNHPSSPLFAHFSLWFLFDSYFA